MKILMLCAAIIACITCSGAPASAEQPPKPRRQIDSRASANHVDLSAWLQSEQSNRKNATQNSSQRKARLLRAYVPACEGNRPNSPDSLGTLCPAAVTLCINTPDPSDLGYWVFTAPAGPPAPTADDWHATGEYACRSAADPEDPQAAAAPVVTAEDFRRLPLPAAGIKIQPPNRRTLINIPTNLYANAGQVILPTTVLGQAVRVRATPLHFHWTYGDGSVRTTADPGGPYPILRTAHTYRHPGTRALTLSTTYSGEYSVGGGPWLPIDGLATVDSPGTDLTVLSAENRLVSQPLG
jgi:hypothetical protein